MDNNKQLDLLLHVGAHKTASTHFERMIRKSREASGAGDLAQPRKAIVREKLTRLLPAVAKDPALADDADPWALRRSLLPEDAEAAAKVDRLFVSDENILGTTPVLFRRQRMYPRAVGLVRAALSLIGRRRLTCFLAIREPAGFVTSAYTEAVRSDGFITTEAYIGDMPLERMRWAGVVSDLARILDGVPLVVWTFEDYPALQDDLARRVLDDGTGRHVVVRKPTAKVREGMSERALDAIREESQAAEGAIGRDRIDAIMEEFPKSEAMPGPQLFGEREQVILARNYLEDLGFIAGLENVALMPHDAARALATRRLEELA